MRKSIVLTIVFFAVRSYGYLGTDIDDGRERPAEVVKVSAYRVFTGTGDPWEMDDSGTEAWEPVQSAACETTGLGGSTNRGGCGRDY